MLLLLGRLQLCSMDTTGACSIPRRLELKCPLSKGVARFPLRPSLPALAAIKRSPICVGHRWGKRPVSNHITNIASSVWMAQMSHCLRGGLEPTTRLFVSDLSGECHLLAAYPVTENC